MTKHYAPVIACTLIDSINRAALATGSVRSASLGAHADYNGHHVKVAYNSYKRYYIAEYTWAGRVILARGSLAECVAAAFREYRKGAKGASVEIKVEPGDEFPVSDYPELVEGDFWTYLQDYRANGPWWMSEVHFAVERGYTHHLLAATDKADYIAHCYPSRAQRNAEAI